MADLFVSASESESQGLTYIESLACGTNIIAKQNEYTESLIGNGDFGKLFVQDEDLASTILAELDKPKDLADLEKNGLNCFTIFLLKLLENMYLNFIKQL